MSNSCAISNADVRTSKISLNGLLYSVSDSGCLHRTRVGLNSIYPSDGRVDRACASGIWIGRLRGSIPSPVKPMT